MSTKEFVKLPEIIKNNPVKETRKIYIPSRGFLFKMKNGFSKSFKRNLDNNNLNIHEFSDSLNAYRDIRRKRKTLERKAMQEKHDKSISFKRANSKKSSKVKK